MADIPGVVPETLEGATVVSDEVIKQASPMYAFWWWSTGLLWNCCGKSMFHAARGMSVLGIWVVVIIVAYDVITQDSLFGSLNPTNPNLTVDLFIVASFVVFSVYIEKITETAFRWGFIIVDPQVHHVVFLFFLLSTVLAVGLAVSAGSQSAISYGPGASNPYPGTNIHQGIYILVLIVLFLITIHGFWFSFAMMSYWGAQTTLERTSAFKAYQKYYHAGHLHLRKQQINVPPNSMLTSGGTFVPTAGMAAFASNNPGSSLLMHPMSQMGGFPIDMNAMQQKIQQTQKLHETNNRMLQDLTSQRNTAGAPAKQPQPQTIVYDGN